MDILIAQNASGQTNSFAMFLPMIIIFAILYFMILRPQNKQRKQHLNFLSGLKKGDKIITRGGLIGVVKSFQGKNDTVVDVDTGNGTVVKISRAYIAGTPEQNMSPKENT
ncbi:MAG: preprotein translocase subunit YajC [Candidatus Marinimicrobia bacterium]|nr:preprotein translocase subunit YajC [Candidatus Neomarinimicrobiota bacterium]